MGCVIPGPGFFALVGQYRDLVDQDLHNTPEGRQVFMAIVEAAGDSSMIAKARAIVDIDLRGPDGYTLDGQAWYSLDALCDRLGIDPKTIPDDILGETYSGPVHSVH